MRICFTHLSGFPYQISFEPGYVCRPTASKPFLDHVFTLFYGDKFNLIVVGGFGILGYVLESKRQLRGPWFGRRSFGMIVSTKQNDRWCRKVVKQAHPELRSISKGSSQTENQRSIQTSATPGERELINAELNELLRLEDDCGQPT